MNRETLFEIATKEFRLFFGSLIGYLFLAAYLGLTLFVFFWAEAFFARNLADVRPMFEWLPILLVFLCCALTMRIWSDERRTGTIEFLATLPATTWELVMGKFFACFGLLVIALILTLPLPVAVSSVADLDWGPVWAGYFAALLLGASYLSIGLFVSSRTENQIVSLIISAALCGIFYMIGSQFFTGLVSNDAAEILRHLGSGSRFESITRGVLDLSDLYFYLSITATFLVLNVFVLRSLGWAQDASRSKHVGSILVCTLIVGNLIIANFWIDEIPGVRMDVTRGQQYTISEVTEQELAQLREPLLIRGYFSAKTHPKLAPLVPQLQDMIREYSVVGGRQVIVEFYDPAENPEIEDEANSKYGIRPAPFQVADRYQNSLVNSYFDVLIRYGDEFEVLGFRDLIEIKVQNESDLLVRLRNPEYDITRTIRKVRSGFQGTGSIFDSITSNVSFTGYISAPNQLPQELEEIRVTLAGVLTDLAESSNGMFNWQMIDPEAGDGSVALEIAEDFGFQPMVTSLYDPSFYFYLLLSDGATYVSLGIPTTTDAEGLTRVIEEGLKRFAQGLMTTVAVHTPVPTSQYAGQPSSGATYDDMYRFLSQSFDVQTTSLREPVPSPVDVLVVAGPSSMDPEQVFEIDQFLMRGGTVVIATSSFDTVLQSQMLISSPSQSGLEQWLDHHGVSIGLSMVLDTQNGGFPIPVERQVGGLTFQDIAIIDYPFYVDIRGDGFVDNNPMVQDLTQISYAWGSPISIDEEMNSERAVTEILRSSSQSWTESYPEVMPKVSELSTSPYIPPAETQSELLAVSVEGRFTSFFDESPAVVEARKRAEELAEAEAEAAAELAAAEEVNAEDTSEENAENEDLVDELEILEEGVAEEDTEDATETEEDTLGVVSNLIDRSPESARLVVIGSSDFISDQAIGMIGSAQGSVYTNSTQFIANIVDVSMEDASLLSIRSRGHFNRTLESLEDSQQRMFEYLNYAFAIVGLAIVFGINFLLSYLRTNRRAQWFGGV